MLTLEDGERTMGFDLMRGRDELDMGLSWPLACAIAREFGWQPQGTVPGAYPDENWSGIYDTNDGQRVTEDDACNLAEALYRAIECFEKRLTPANAENLLAPLPIGVPIHPQYLRWLAEFCMRGSFIIL